MLNLSIELQGILRLLLSLLCGALIGLERERGHRPAGLRTHMLVCVGACLVMVTSFWAVEKYGLSGDPLRMSAQVISGIGFLGAGTIIKAGRDIRGLTTAACLWIVACIGLAIGVGYYVGGLAVTGLILLTLHIFKIAERKIEYAAFELHIRTENEPHIPSMIADTIIGWGVGVSQFAAEQDGDELRVTMAIELSGGLKRAAFIGQLMSLPGILGVSDQAM